MNCGRPSLSEFCPLEWSPLERALLAPRRETRLRGLPRCFSTNAGGLGPAAALPSRRQPEQLNAPPALLPVHTGACARATASRAPLAARGLFARRREATWAREQLVRTSSRGVPLGWSAAPPPLLCASPDHGALSATLPARRATLPAVVSPRAQASRFSRAQAARLSSHSICPGRASAGTGCTARPRPRTWASLTT